LVGGFAVPIESVHVIDRYANPEAMSFTERELAVRMPLIGSLLEPGHCLHEVSRDDLTFHAQVP
jgi:hypothetical protein